MCTVSWRLSSPGSYQLWFNRDEQRTRPAALPPRLHSENGAHWLCPIDPKGNGTWLSVNTQGLTVCLLNNYIALAPATPAHLSRGALVLACAPARDLAAVDHLVREPRWQSLPGFFLLALAADGQARLWTWDCRQLTRTDHPDSPLTTSAFAPARIIAERKAVFRQLAATSDADLPNTFHNQHDPARSAESVLMSRPDATTVSQSRIEVSPTRIAFHYRAAPGPALLALPWQTSELSLRPC